MTTPTTQQEKFVTLKDIQAAQQIIAGRVQRTPMLFSATLGERLGVQLHFKAELFQKTGSFKVRGALNKMHHLTDDEKRRGVIAISAGNHAAGLAYAAKQYGVQATIVMPEFAVRSKIEATEYYGGMVVLYGGMADIFPKMLELQAAGGLTLVHPFDDPH
ncbi:MAG: pyridoxal-phosphate dependent enzyme, partial [Burkholderiales bacterium]|nr:pyridoxal-phosphate dependent enzyme [Anaerolineae bacterium]